MSDPVVRGKARPVVHGPGLHHVRENVLERADLLNRPLRSRTAGGGRAGSWIPWLPDQAALGLLISTLRFCARQGGLKLEAQHQWRHLPSDTGAMLATGVPECHDFEIPSSCAVVDEVSRSGQVQATGFGVSGVLDLCSYTRLFDGADSDVVNRLRDYLELRGDQRSGGWQGHLHRSEDFIRFTAYSMIVEMLSLHGGVAKTQIVLKWRKYQ